MDSNDILVWFLIEHKFMLYFSSMVPSQMGVCQTAAREEIQASRLAQKTPTIPLPLTHTTARANRRLV